MSVDKIIPANNYTEKDVQEILEILGTYSEDKNSTIEAIRAKFKTNKKLTVKESMPFKSSNKWSGISLEDATYILGAPEVISKNKQEVENIYLNIELLQ